MVFGHVISGKEVVKKIEAIPIADTKTHRPVKQVIIEACGELIPGKYKLYIWCLVKKTKNIKSETKSKSKKSKKERKKKKRKHSSSSNSNSDS